MPSRYHHTIDPSATNNAHAYALELIGWNRRVLELGAASGHVTQALAHRNCEVTAIEFDTDATAELEQVADRVIVGDLDAPDVFDGLAPDFDVVLAGDVLEHLLRPNDVLSRAARLLRPGGQVVVSVPHIGHIDVRLALLHGTWDYQSWGLLDETHTRFFTLKSIRQMVAEAGLVITDLRRVRIPAFETELGVDRSAIPTEALELALADPEAETYQFVFTATADDGDYQNRRLAERNVELQTELERIWIANRALESDRDRIAAENARLAEQAESRHALAAEVSALRGELDRTRRALWRVERSVSWQTFQRLRSRLFAIAGGERSPLILSLQSCLRAFGRAFLVLED
jgi:2-polyprenyl-3-methyl-5-hydroxy-6-metoxy-1,4-benzoquinol methylase